jgi:hypothetical protein
MGAANSVAPPEHREAPDQPAPLNWIGVIAAVGFMTMTSWSVATVRWVAGAICPATYTAARPIGVFQIEVLAKGHVSGFR